MMRRFKKLLKERNYLLKSRKTDLLDHYSEQLAFAGLATLWQAIAADMGASLLVVANVIAAGYMLLLCKQCLDCNDRGIVLYTK